MLPEYVQSRVHGLFAYHIYFFFIFVSLSPDLESDLKRDNTSYECHHINTVYLCMSARGITCSPLLSMAIYESNQFREQKRQRIQKKKNNMKN